MATRADYRSALKDKLVALEDGGYGDFDYTDAEYNTYLDLAVSNLYPALYKKVAETGLAPVDYGTNDLQSITVSYPDRVFLIEDANELEVLYGWRPSPAGKILNIPQDFATSFNAYYHDAYTLPNDDVTDAGISAMWKPLIVLGALIEALESRQDTGVRGDDPQPAGYPWVSLLDRLKARYESLKAEKAMALPLVVM